MNEELYLFDMQTEAKLTPQHLEILGLYDVDFHNRSKNDTECKSEEELHKRYPRSYYEPNPSKYTRKTSVHQREYVSGPVDRAIPDAEDKFQLIGVYNYLEEDVITSEFLIQGLDEDDDEDQFESSDDDDEEEPTGKGIGTITVKRMDVDNVDDVNNVD